MNRFATVLIVVVCFLILTDLTKVLFEFCVIEVFKFWVILWWMKEGCKSLSLGMPWNPKLLSKNEQPTKLGDAPEWHPRFLLTTIGNLLETIFLFVTWYEFCLEHLLWYESLLVLLCVLSVESLLDTPFWETQKIMLCLHLCFT